MSTGDFCTIGKLKLNRTINVSNCYSKNYKIGGFILSVLNKINPAMTPSNYKDMFLHFPPPLCQPHPLLFIN